MTTKTKAKTTQTSLRGRIIRRVATLKRVAKRIQKRRPLRLVSHCSKIHSWLCCNIFVSKFQVPASDIKSVIFGHSHMMHIIQYRKGRVPIPSIWLPGSVAVRTVARREDQTRRVGSQEVRETLECTQVSILGFLGQVLAKLPSRLSSLCGRTCSRLPLCFSVF